jgi:ribosomal protein S18 acetylase RimI-like enzyme
MLLRQPPVGAVSGEFDAGIEAACPAPENRIVCVFLLIGESDESLQCADTQRWVPPMHLPRFGEAFFCRLRYPHALIPRTVQIMATNDFRIRPMQPDEIALAADWAAAEGWNPGLADTGCFATVDAQGFFIGELDGAPAATISCVNYDDRFAFLGFYIVRPDLRGRGFGWRIWKEAMAHAGSRTVGLDGVVAQQENYRKSGFRLAYPNIRYGGTVTPAAPPAGVVALEDVPFATVAADDATVFPAPRSAFLRAWLCAPGHLGRAVVRDGGLAAWGVIRPCRSGHKIGPLVADDCAGAEAVFAALVAATGGGEVFLDIPSVNSPAVALAQSHGLKPVFETARMYTGPILPTRLERVFGVTTFELG